MKYLSRARSYRVGVLGAVIISAVLRGPAFSQQDASLVEESTTAVQARVAPILADIRQKNISAVPDLIASYDLEKQGLVRFWIVKALSSLDSAKGMPVFEKALSQDPAPEVRSGAAVALGKKGGRFAVTALTKALKIEKEDGVRQTIVFWLGELKDIAAEDALGESLSQDANSNVRTMAADSLKRHKGKRAKGLLKKGAQDSDARVRKIANE